MRLYLFVVVALITFGGFAGNAHAADGPLADAGLDQTVAEGTAVQLDGTGSIHPDGRITSYEWSVVATDGQSFPPACTNCERTEFVPSSPGEYEVTLTVTGDGGNGATDTLYLNVTRAGPEIDLDGPRTATVGETISFGADTESPDATLDRIGWAVDDGLVDDRALSGTTERNEVRFAFPDTDTYRIQAVVSDVNGRTAYAERYVRVSRDGESEPIDGPNPTVGSGSSLTSERISDVRITFETDGFYRIPRAGSLASDSTYVGTEIEQTGIDGGENAPWEDSATDQLKEIEATIGGVFTGREGESIECEMTGIADKCRQAAIQAEREGRTVNDRSPDDSGAFDRYGLEGIERIGGPDPTTLDPDRRATVVFIVRDGTEGVFETLADAGAEGVEVVRDAGREVIDEASDAGSEAKSSVDDIRGSLTSELLTRSADDESGESTDDLDELDHRSSIFLDGSDTGGSAAGGGSSSPGGSPSGGDSGSSDISDPASSSLRNDSPSCNLCEAKTGL